MSGAARRPCAVAAVIRNLEQCRAPAVCPAGPFSKGPPHSVGADPDAAAETGGVPRSAAPSTGFFGSMQTVDNQMNIPYLSV